MKMSICSMEDLIKLISYFFTFIYFLNSEQMGILNLILNTDCTEIDQSYLFHFQSISLCKGKCQLYVL